MSLRQTLAMSNGSYAIFYQSPVSVAFLVEALLMILLALKPLIRKGMDWKWREHLCKADENE